MNRYPGWRPKTKGLDRGRRQGARWVFVTPEGGLVEYDLAKTIGVDGRGWILFRSRKEAKRWIALRAEAEFGTIRNLRRQVDFPLFAVRPDGAKEKACSYRADFVYERNVPGTAESVVVEDSKPGGGLREDVYKLKKRWFEIQYGRPILET
jgi:hypothetical protein